VKVIKGSLTDEQLKAFRDETILMMTLRPHPNLVQLLGIVSISPHFCIILEFLHGGNLVDYLEKNPNPPMSRLLEIIKGIAAGMLHLSLERIVHRDLAARNVLLDRNGVPKVADFGYSRIIAEQEEGHTKSDIGPIKWMAPESIGDREYSEKSDVWAFAITCWEIFKNGEMPHANLALLEAAIQIRDNNLTPTIPEHVPKELCDLLKKCWQREPKARPTFAELCSALKTLSV